MQLDDYQAQALTTAMYPGRGDGYLDYVSKKLAGECGEFLEKLGKQQRTAQTLTLNRSQFSGEQVADLGKELGDILWYVAAAADELGLTLGEVAQANLDKLASRADRSVIDGAGDDR